MGLGHDSLFHQHWHRVCAIKAETLGGGGPLEMSSILNRNFRGGIFWPVDLNSQYALHVYKISVAVDMSG